MTKEVLLTRGYVAIVDDEDFERFSTERWMVSGTAPHLYAKRQETVDGKKVVRWMHREVCGAPPNLLVDHINRNTLDNRRSNLRACTHRENLQNRGSTKREGGSQYKGVSTRSGRVRAYITINGEFTALGGFSDEIRAAVAYDAAAREHFGEFAKLNFDPARDWILPSPSPTRRSGETRKGRAA
jgi:hypothetical protein